MLQESIFSFQLIENVFKRKKNEYAQVDGITYTNTSKSALAQ